nr:hypothetical protein [Tanacetum cinerariifolium]
MIFNIDYAMKHSYSNDDTCFSINVIDEILEEDFDALLDKGSKILHSIEGTLLEEEIFAEFNKFMAMTTDEKSDSESDTEELTFEKITINTKYKIKTSLEEPPMDLKLKPFPDNLEYVFLKEPSFLPVIISSQLSKEKKTNLTYAYRRMPFGLCNALATFQRFKLAIFHDMITESVEVFMDDFSVFRNSFESCLNNLDKMLQRCRDAHLVLKWEKCHFMVKEGIVIGHKVSSVGLEVDKAKVNVISKLPPPTSIKDTTFKFDDECQKAFGLLKEKLTCAPVIVSPDWNLPFELMCDANDFTVGAVLGLKDEIKDRKGTKNFTPDHLSRIENDESSDDSEVNDNFPRETLTEINTKDEPWFANFSNYLVGDVIPKGMTYQQRNKFFSDLKHYFWEEPYLFKVCSDGSLEYISRLDTSKSNHYALKNTSFKKDHQSSPKCHKSRLESFDFAIPLVDYSITH